MWGVVPTAFVSIRAWEALRRARAQRDWATFPEALIPLLDGFRELPALIFGGQQAEFPPDSVEAVQSGLNGGSSAAHT